MNVSFHSKYEIYLKCSFLFINIFLFQAKILTIFLFVLVAIEISSVNGGCWDINGCVGDDGVEYNDGDRWIATGCHDCSCSLSQRLLVSCVNIRKLFII